MNQAAQDHWQRALRARQSAQLLLDAGDHDGAASRAYYAAFHALSALLATEGRTFTRHTHLEAAVHRDLVREGRVDASIGKAFSTLREYRARGDYGGQQHINEPAAQLAVRCAAQIVEAVQKVDDRFGKPPV